MEAQRQTIIRPFLMFQEGNAEEAMRFYISLFPGGELLEIERYGEGEMGLARTVKVARFRVADQVIMCIDSPIKHGFTFTPAVSLYVDCADEAELARLCGALSEGGSVLMPLDNYGFSRQFTWVSDRFGVSWQLNLK